ncbi:MAG: SHOCT-like domain-containing protein [Ktedonobacteraceae bacterium]
MAASIDERNRILHMVETGKVTAAQAAQLLDMLAVEQPHSDERSQKRMVRVRVTNLTNNRQKANVVIPVSLIHVGLRLATRLLPQVSGSALEDLLRAIASGVTGRLLDLQDLEEGERVEIYTE